MVAKLKPAVIVISEVGAVQTNQQCFYVIRNEVGLVLLQLQDIFLLLSFLGKITFKRSHSIEAQKQCFLILLKITSSDSQMYFCSSRKQQQQQQQQIKKNHAKSTQNKEKKKPGFVNYLERKSIKFSCDSYLYYPSQMGDSVLRITFNSRRVNHFFADISSFVEI